jgi:hypothetical protein
VQGPQDYWEEYSDTILDLRPAPEIGKNVPQLPAGYLLKMGSTAADHDLIPSSPNWGVGSAFFAIHSFDYLLNADEH